MDKFLLVIKSIDWVFAGIMLIGGRYFGNKYFRISRKDSLNFLGFATGAGIIWLIIQYYTAGIARETVGNLFITYLFTTSFYELLAKFLFEKIESVLPWFKTDQATKQTTITIEGGQVKDITEIPPEKK